MNFDSFSVSVPSRVKAVTESFNKMLKGVVPSGIYQGYDVALAGGLNVNVAVAGGSSTATVESGEYLLTVQAVGAKTISVPIGNSTIVIEAIYIENTPTTFDVKLIPTASVDPAHLVLVDIIVPSNTSTITQGMLNFSRRKETSLSLSSHSHSPESVGALPVDSTAVNSVKLNGKPASFYAEATDTSLVSKAVFDALREKVIRGGAGSGFAEVGKSQSYNPIASVNEGMWAAYSQANTIRMGRGHTDKAGSSRTDSPLVNANGVQHVVDRVGNTSESTYNNVIISFPPAPDGTKTYDPNATPNVVQHASAAEAFEGVVTNGDFRNGTTGWAAQYLGTGSSGSVANNELTLIGADYTNRAQWSQLIQTTIGVEYTIEFTCTQDEGAYVILEEDNVGTIIHQLSNDGSYSLKFISTSNTNTRLTLRGQGGTSKFKNIFVRPSTEQVITSRQDFVFLESFHEKIVGKDGSGSRRFHPLGGTQYGPSSWKGIALNKDYAQSYSAFYEGDTETHGYSKSWDDMDIFERELAVKDPDNNFYSDDGNLIAVKYRVRVVEGLGDTWQSVGVEATNTPVRYSANKRVKPQGKQVSILGGDLGDYGYLAGERHYGWFVGRGSSERQYTTDEQGSILGQYSALSTNSAGTSLGAFDENDFYGHNGECHLIPIALVQRRNSGVFEPVFNSNGCAIGRNVGGTTRGWDQPDAVPINSTSDAFDSAKYTEITGKISDGRSGRPDDKFYDAIYASDVIADLRMSSRRVPKQELEESYLRKAISGKIRGAESVPYLAAVASSNTASTGYANAVKVTIGAWTELSPLEVDTDTKCVGSMIVSGITHKIDSYLRSGSGELYLVSSSLGSQAGNSGLSIGFCLSVMKTHKQANPTWTDIIGSPDNIAATFPNGVEGQWIPVIPSTGTNTYPLNRKVTDASPSSNSYENTIDNGASWSSGVWSGVLSFNSITNSFDSALTGVNVRLLHYTAKAHFTQDDVNSKVLSRGSVYATNHYYPTQGSEMVSTLIGKVATDNTNPRQFTTNIDGIVINSGVMEVVTNDAPSHKPISLGSNGTSPAVKVYDYLSSENDVAKLCFLYKGLVYKTGAFKPWGDNNKFSMVNNQSTETNLNGDTVLVGMASFLTNHFIVNE